MFLSLFILIALKIINKVKTPYNDLLYSTHNFEGVIWSNLENFLYLVIALGELKYKCTLPNIYLIHKILFRTIPIYRNSSHWQSLE